MTTALYRHFDADGTLLYVGVSLRPIQRLREHENSSTWADSIARVEIERFETRSQAWNAERNAIRAERPKHNVVHNRWQTREVSFKVKSGRQTLEFKSLGEVSSHLRSCAVRAHKKDLPESELKAILRAFRNAWPGLWRATTQKVDRYGDSMNGIEFIKNV